MGVTSGDTDSDAPSITVTVSSFYIQQTETTKAQWDEVRNWAVNNGYTDLLAGRWKAPNHPVQKVSWWEVVKWCNARSEKEGLTPVYSVFGAVMRTGTTEPVANWSANGYRLPTEAEWEKAARGGVSGKRFPWGADTISYAQANFSNGGSSEAYATGTTTWHPSYDDGVFPYTSPVGSFAPNGYGLYDMAGNVLEWCWDWYGSSYYTTSNGTTDPRGPVSGSGTVWTGSSWSYSGRVIRGGSWSAGPRACRAAARFNDVPGPVAPDTAGFRPVRSSVSEGGVVLPTVSNPTSSSINPTDATLGGNVTGDGGAAITERGVVYSASATNNDPLIGGTSVTKVTAIGTTGVFTAAVTGLTQGTGYSYKAYAINSEGTTYTSVGTFTSQSTNADLSALTLSSGNLSPAFASGENAYTASVANTVSSMTLTPTAAQADATIEVRVNGGTFVNVASSSASAALALNVGNNKVEVRVTAQDGMTKTTYSFEVTRRMASESIVAAQIDQLGKITRPAILSAGGFGPVFAFQQGNLAVWQASGYGRIALFNVAQNAGQAASSHLATIESPDVAYDNPDFGQMLAFGPQLTLFAGSPHTWISAPHDGRIYQYDNSSMASPVLVRKFAESPHTAGYFGSNLAIDGDILITAQGANGGAPQTRAGAFIYRINADKSLTLLKTQGRSADFMNPSGAAVSGDVCAMMFGYVSGNDTSAEAWVFRVTRINGVATGVEGPVSIPFSNTTMDASRAQPSGGSSYHALALKDNRIAFGIYGDDLSAADNALHLYNVSSGGNLAAIEEAVITSPGVGASSRFGRRLLFINNGALLVSDPLAMRSGTTAKGKVHVYEPSSPGQWNVSRVIESTTTNASEAFGEFLALDDTHNDTFTMLAVGARTNADNLNADHDIYLFGVNSTNADLSSLTASSGVLSPTFSSVTTAYNASVSNSTSSITITPTRAQTDATMELRVNSGPYSAVTSGSASGALVLNVGSNTVEVLVTAQDGVTQKTYTVTVTRMAAPTVTSPTASSVTTTGATLGGNVTADGGATITERGVVYSVTSTNPNPSIGGVGVSKVAASGNMGVFTVEVTGLALCDGYSYKAYATNSEGTSYSSVGTFTNRMPYAFRPEAPPYTLPVTSEGGALLSYSIMSGSSIASVAGNVLTFTGQMGPVTLRATGAEIDDQYLTFRVESSPNWKKVFTGSGSLGSFTYGLKEDGSIWSWGANFPGDSPNLGVAGQLYRRRPLQMGTDSDWADLSAGEFGNCFAAIKTDGRLFTWGSNNAGQLGVGTTIMSSTPVLVNGSTDWKQAVVGSAHMIALKRDGSLWAWGINVNGRLGDGTTVNQSIPIRIGAEVDWRFVAAGNAASYAIKNDGSLWAWGFNGNGRLGDGTTADRLVPTRIGMASDWLTVEGGNTHAMALKTDGSLWTWGANASGQIGNGTTTNQLTPVQLSPGQTWSKIYAGRDNSMAIRSNGALWAWGSNTRGQLGDGTMINQLYPVQVGYHHDWKEIACALHSAGLKLDGRMWSWGTDDEGELGNTSWWHNPIGGAATNVSSFSTGGSVTAFIRKDGSLWTLGTNTNLCLGLSLSSASFQQWEPARIGTANNWVSVTAGANHVLALKRDGTMWAWGRNTEGQLGVANTVNQSTPVQVGTDSDWVFVEGGTNHSIAIKADGSLWSWGVNTNGQLGIDSLNSSTIPVRVGSLNDWKIVSAANHNLAIKKDGSIWAWGMNNQALGGGQIGNNTTTDVLSPVRVGTETDWAQVQAGQAHSLALKTTGSLWGWGSNVWGEIDQATRSTPGRIGTATDWETISAGSLLTVAINADGAAWTSGNNRGGGPGQGVGAPRNIYTVRPLTRLGLTNAYRGTPDGGTAGGRNVLLTKAGDLWAAGPASTANVGIQKRKLRPQIVFADLEQQTLSFGQNGNLQVGQSLSLEASSTSGLPIQYSIAGNGVITGNIVTATAPGKIEVVGWQAGDEVWDITPPMAITIDVSKADQEIHFAVISDKLTPDSVNLAAIGGGSNNPVTFVVTSGPAVITNNLLTFTNAGIVTITASQAGNDNYVAAPDVSRTFTVGSAQIATQPQPATAEQNGSATLSVVATGVGNLVYQWQKDGVDLPSATNATLTIPAFKPWHVGSYRVRVSDSLDNAWSNTAQLSLNATQPASLWQDLLLFLPFAGNATDFSTSARTITQSNVGVGDSPAGTPSGSATFNGSSSRMDFSPDLPDLTEMTVSCWIKTTGASGSRFIFADWDDADGNDLSVSLDGLKLVVGTTKNGSTIGYWTSPDVFVADSWKHLIWVMGATQSKIFIDGVLYQTINGTASNSGYKLNSNIGYSAYGGGQQFLSGGLTAFRIYGRALTESEAVQLYQSDAPMPEIELEQPTGTALVDGSATTTWQALPTGGTAAAAPYVIRNVGVANLLNLGLTKSGTHAADFLLGSLSTTTLAPGESTAFTVTFAPGAGASGTRTATLQVASNDADENPFDIALRGTAYSTTLDADSDGMNDWGEVKLSALGFDWQTPNTALVSTYYENASAAGLYNQTLYNANRTAGQNDVINSPNAYSLYTLSQVQNLNVGVPLLQRNSATGEFTLTIGVDQSTNLTNWTPLPMTAPQTIINSQGKVEFRFTTPKNAAFFRLQTQPAP